MSMPYWTPATEGTGFELTPIMQSLAPVRDYVTVVSGLNGPKGANHAGGSTGFLTGRPNQQDDGTLADVFVLKADVSIDQLMAKEFGQHTQLASLELAVDEGLSTSCDGNLPCAYTNTISWHTPTLPMLAERDPRVVFERLFGDSGTTDPAVRAARQRRDKSILDAVIEQANALTQSVGASDRTKVTEYLEAVRDMEQRLQRAEAQSAKSVSVFTQPTAIPESYAEHATLMYDLQALAFQADLTRITTFMMAYETTSRAYPELGLPEGHHPISHHRNDPELLAAEAKINAFHMGFFAKYLEKLRSTPDGDGSLLDHMIILYGAGMSDSNTHIHDNLPLLLAGGGAGQLKGGRHLKYNGDPSPNLLVTLMDKMGMPIDRIGGSTGKVDLRTLSGV
jgi:hypothetical protein